MQEVPRIFSIEAYVRPSDGEPIRSVVLVTEESAVIVWHASPGQEIAAHVHPHGQDTWTVISGEADYYQGGGVSLVLRQEISLLQDQGKYMVPSTLVPSLLSLSQLLRLETLDSRWRKNRILRTMSDRIWPERTLNPPARSCGRNGSVLPLAPRS